MEGAKRSAERHSASVEVEVIVGFDNTLSLILHERKRGDARVLSLVRVDDVRESVTGGSHADEVSALPTLLYLRGGVSRARRAEAVADTSELSREIGCRESELLDRFYRRLQLVGDPGLETAIRLLPFEDDLEVAVAAIDWKCCSSR